MTRDDITEWLAEHSPMDEKILLMDGLEEAFIGVATRFEPMTYLDENGLERIKGGTHRTFAVYDYDKIIASLVAEGMDTDEAEELRDRYPRRAEHTAGRPQSTEGLGAEGNTSVARRRVAESRAEGVLRDLLATKGWDSRRPPAGQLLIKQEYKDFRDLDRLFRSKTGPGDGLPEGVLVDAASAEPIAVIEAKATEGQIATAIAEAEGYATTCIEVGGFRPVAIGVAGDEDRFAVRVSFWTGVRWAPVTYDGHAIEWLPTPDGIERIRAATGGVADLRPSQPSPAVLADRADEINRLLREAKLKDEYRPGVVAAIMLALWESKGRIRRDPDHILVDVNEACANAFNRAGKATLAMSLRVDEANAFLALRARRICTILESLSVTVLTAEHDYLGQLYETFFRYTGGNTIGQYFTPRHITNLAAELTQVTSADRTLDPAVGTGGFLIAAMERSIREGGLSRPDADALVKTQLIGFESEPVTAALCVANMILRGDGTTGVWPEDCFTSTHYPSGETAATVALMNPPFPHKGTDTPPERFIDRALYGLSQHGRLAVIVPSSLLSKASKKTWRDRVLTQNSLKAVIALPGELFQPYASATTALLVLEKGVRNEGSTFYARVVNDGYRLKKGVRLPAEGSQVPALVTAYREHRSIPDLTHVSTVDNRLGWSPGAYLPLLSRESTEVAREVDRLIRERVAFVVRYAPDLARMKAAIEAGTITPTPYRTVVGTRRTAAASPTVGTVATGTIGAHFDIYYGQKALHSKERLTPGDALVISSSGADNGAYGFFDFDAVLLPPFVTVPSTGSIGEARVQEYACGVTDDCLVLLPKEGTERPLLYIAAAVLRLEMWRFDYGRKLTPARVRDFPMSDAEPLIAHISARLADAAAVETAAMDRFGT